MGLKIGIVGLPNIGKSTLFNAITGLSVEAINYPFATIEPNIGVVEVPDERLNNIAKIFNSKKKIGVTIDFVDIAGLIAGASKGEGLGNAFLANIRETDAICHIVRCFKNKEITHVNNEINPLNDIETINIELILADETIVDKRIAKIGPKLKSNQNNVDIFENEILLKIKKQLSECRFINELNLDDDEKKVIKSLNLITAKNIIFVGNVDDDCISADDDLYLQLKKYCEKNNFPLVKVCAKIEEEISLMSNEDKEVFKKEYNIEKSGLEKLIELTFKILDLSVYFTAGPEESRAWQFKKNWTAPKCAGIIHTDFEKGFIKADIYKYTDLLNYPSEHELKNAGKIRLEGKSYVMQDGDVCFFKFNK